MAYGDSDTYPEKGPSGTSRLTQTRMHVSTRRGNLYKEYLYIEL